MSYPITVKLPDGSTAESDLETIVSQLADQLGTVTRELAACKELLGAKPHSGSTFQTGLYLLQVCCVILLGCWCVVCVLSVPPWLAPASSRHSLPHVTK
jgi:hypothetical protein